jgi:glucose-6-phosphate isomerase
MANEEVSLNYKEEVNLYYKNVSSDIIGEEHGITPEDLEKLAEQSSKVILKLNREREAKNTPYRDLPHQTYIAQQVKEIVDELKVRCENLVVLGIGGSALGNIALQTALKPYMYNLDDKQRTGPRLFIFDNIDPSQFDSFLQWINDKLDKTIFNVISKSGQATETVSQFMIIHQLLLDKLGSEACKKQIIITTDANQGILREITDNVGYRSLDVPKGVGGRFSVLSAVGLFSADMCGIKIDQLLEGAYDMDKRVRNTNFRQNPAAINAAINYHFYKKGKKISVMMPYSYHLKDLADWYRQLWAESLGKARDLADKEVFVGPTPVKALGTTDQHSQVQLYLEGPNDKLFTFLQVNKFDEDKDPIIGPAPRCAPELDFLAGNKLSTLLNNEKKATEYALLESKRPCLTVIFPEVNAYTVGQFIYLYEVTTSFAGALFKVNPYDQGSVDKVKEATFALMNKPGDEYREFSQEIRSKTEIDGEYLV